jgi:hypothetical protein
MFVSAARGTRRPSTTPVHARLGAKALTPARAFEKRRDVARDLLGRRVGGDRHM